MNTIQLIVMGVWLAITFYLTYSVLVTTLHAIVRDVDLSIGVMALIVSVGWAGILLYYTFN